MSKSKSLSFVHNKNEREVFFMAIIFIRTALFYILTVLSLRLMGKRQIGELEPTELVVTILISQLATMPMMDLKMPVIYTVVAIAALVAFEILSSVIAMKSSLFRSFLSGDYSIIIDNGVINQNEMTNSQLTRDELMEELRQHGAIHVEDCLLYTSRCV